MGTITPLSTIPTDYTVLTTDYVGNMIYENGALKEIMLPEGYYQNGTFYYYLKDHLGNNRVTINSSGIIVEKSHYYPSGTRFFSESTNNTLNPLPYRYNGKEMEAMNGLNQMDYGARRRFSWGPIWTGVDPLAEKYYSISPYSYCAGNPVLLVDPNGMDWFYYSADGKSGPTWNWRDESSYHTGVKDSNGKEVVLQGQEAVVTFDGSRDEKLGKGDNLFGEGAKLSIVTVYGPDGKVDIKNYKGFSMSSDFDTFGAINNGKYTVNYRSPGKSGKLKSNWAINNTNPVDCLDGNNPSPIDPFSSTQKNGAYIHTSNKNGFAGSFYKNGNVTGAITTGCLLIVPSGHGMNGFDEFNSQLQGVSSFLLILNRSVPINYIIAPTSNNSKPKWQLY